MVRHQRRHMAIVGAGAALAVGLAGCGETDPSATGPSGPTSTPSSTSEPTSSPGSTPPPTTTTTPPDSGTTTPPPTSDSTGKAGPCAATDIKVTLGKGGAAAGSYYAPLRFTNTSSSPCAIGGYPGVSYVAGADAHQVGPPAERVEQPWQPVTLRPGEAAHATVRFLQVRNYDEAACLPTHVRAIRVYPPGETASTLVPHSGMGCTSSDIPGEQLTVKPIVAGPGSGQAG